ncbi:MAG: BREX-2 system adenine-specific DNA-methyltransferase PglX [Bryobacter sp.]|nr:BREX-2 system adenine-specific DNA-methyltransferase PglX [Bryobacter sp.]
MINEIALREGLKKLLKQTEEDILQRLSDEPELERKLKKEHSAAVAAGRSAASAFLSFRDECKTQAAVHWLLGCVFVRFLEDNLLIDEAWIAGPGERLQQALDRRQLFYRDNPRANDTDYLIRVFETVAVLPDMAGLFDREHNPIWRLGPTGPQAMNILKFFQQRDEDTGEIQHDFTDPDWGTRFLGDLYQNLSDFARKRYALCQTPEFVIQFILDRTLTPAVDAFGLPETRIIDPTCGSGHFLLAAFDRLYQRWEQRAPDENPRQRVQHALDAVHGVDINPFAVSIARFRLLVVALKNSGIRKLKDAPDFRFQLAAGDSLLHGPQMGEEGGIQRHLENDPTDHYFETEDAPALRRILGQEYHAVVGNPPYINVADAALREKYRRRYGSCRGKYQLGVPFTERFFNLAKRAEDPRTEPVGFVGLITSNAFMKRSFGIDLVEKYIPKWDLTHVIDTSGVYLPGHGTPTAIMFGRRRRPEHGADTIRAVRGIRGETGVPGDPAQAPVWLSITAQVDVANSESRFVSTSDVQRRAFHTHPWAIGGGGAAELKEQVDEAGLYRLGSIADVGVQTLTLADDVFIRPNGVYARNGCASVASSVSGEAVRDWFQDSEVQVYIPEKQDPIVLWCWRQALKMRLSFGRTQIERGLRWWDYGMTVAGRLNPPKLIFGEIATHNHFILDSIGLVCDQTAPVVRLTLANDHEALAPIHGLLNSSTACFWLKQVCFPKGGDHVGTEGARITKVQWEERYAFDSTKLKQFPLPEGRPLTLTEQIQQAVEQRTSLLPNRLCGFGTPTLASLDQAREKCQSLLRRMIALQEELDWQVYHLYGLLSDDLSLPPDQVPPIELGQRPFEIVMARQMEAGELETTWFERHGSTPITQVLLDWPENYRKAVEKRIQIIESNRDIALIEQPEYKRRWNLPSWDELQQKALENWLLDRMETETLWQEPELLTCARLADRLRRDPDFVQVAEIYSTHTDLTELVTKLALKQAVPFLPVLRYKASGLEKRKEWEKVWDLQRKEDAGQKVEIPVPPKYKAADFLEATFWNLRGSLDVPKERFIAYQHLQRDADATPVLAWAGWDHLKQATALAAYYQHVKEEEGWGADRLKPVLAGLLELIPWLKQWHNEEDPSTGERMGDTFEAFIEAECQEFGFTVENVRAWAPPQGAPRRGRRRT